MKAESSDEEQDLGTHAHVLRLPVQPRLASWNANHHPDQRAVQHYLDEVEAAVVPVIDVHRGAPLYLRVHAALPEGAELLRGHDVENYLTPLAQRLRNLPFVHARGTKAVGGESFIEVGLADAGLQEHRCGFSSITVRGTGAAGTNSWKRDLREQIIQSGASRAPPGPLTMAIVIRCSPKRAWHNLWKPLGDALGPILGESGTNPFHPADDRIVDLTLSFEPSEEVGWDVEARVYWHVSA